MKLDDTFELTIKGGQWRRHSLRRGRLMEYLRKLLADGMNGDSWSMLQALEYGRFTLGMRHADIFGVARSLRPGMTFAGFETLIQEAEAAP